MRTLTIGIQRCPILRNTASPRAPSTWATTPLDEQGALSPPLYLTATYTQDSIEAFDQIPPGRTAGLYVRPHAQPPQALLEERLASLEGAEARRRHRVGHGRPAHPLFSLLRAGDEIVVDQIVYGTAFTLFSQGLERFGVRAVFADFTRPETVAAAIGEKTRAVYFETPANPNLRLVDIAAVSAIARGRGLLTIVDNTFATPVLQRPLEHGADIVLHSATKYLGGHGDLLAGAVLGRKEHIDAIRLQGLRYSPAPRSRPSRHSWFCAASRRWSCACSATANRPESGGAVARARRGGRRVLSRPA